MDLSRLEWARMNLEQVRAQLLDAAAFAKYLPPEQLERAAWKIGEGLRIYREETEPADAGPPGAACIDYRGAKRQSR
ncbi:hypothetical protein B7C42_07653 [Nocardia cerradoensis]|uniref:Uncharacterized protein n=1 Tax=Nocardia cerradoensis TaxID=85688 RepID=A0A231GUH8_9NOCA|nr:DUF6374 family protein [Nocardia cerradoensis]OXR40228.1 hypothetical protein B7C42_07653 [Nocardia cerradoensis]